MGLSASQARYLSLTARRNNNEFQGQQIAQQRTMLAKQMDMLSIDYTKMKNNRELMFVRTDPNGNSASTKRLTYEVITDTNPFSGLGMRIVDENGFIVVPKPPEQDYDQMAREAAMLRDKSISNKCLEALFANSDGTTSRVTYSGSKFLETYLTVTENDPTKNPILDKDGNAVDFAVFKNQIQSLSAPDFHDFWQSNEFQFGTQNLISGSRLYTEDDTEALAKYESTIADIQAQRSTRYNPDEKCLDPDYLENKLRTGEWILQKPNTDYGTSADWLNTPWGTESRIADSLDSSDDAYAEAVYTQKSAFFQQQDKLLELQMKKLDTEHSALQTEIDSVKKVIDKNIDGSFKTFG